MQGNGRLPSVQPLRNNSTIPQLPKGLGTIAEEWVGRNVAIRGSETLQGSRVSWKRDGGCTCELGAAVAAIIGHV